MTTMKEEFKKEIKDGDVLAVDKVIFIYKRTLASHIVSYCKLINDVFESTSDARTCCEGNTYIHPATKEQRDLLFQKIKEEGYEWDIEKKELKKISQEYPLTPDECIKSTWSDEDEDMRYKATAVIHRLCAEGKEYVWSINTLEKLFCWLKSLKPQNTWKPSDEQIKAIRLARSFVTDDFGDNPTLSEILIELEKQLQQIKENKL